MTKLLKILSSMVIVATTLNITGCLSTSKYEKPERQVPVPKVINITENLTTKSEIRTILGQPTGYLSNNLSYDTGDRPSLLIYLTYIEKDGSEYKYVVGSRYTNNHLSISLNDKGIVDSIHVY